MCCCDFVYSIVLFSRLCSCDYLSSKCVASNIIAGKCDIMLFEFKVFELNVVILFSLIY